MRVKHPGTQPPMNASHTVVRAIFSLEFWKTVRTMGLPTILRHQSQP
jgi:hypothetical protein